jgi:hypothetical protein
MLDPAVSTKPAGGTDERLSDLLLRVARTNEKDRLSIGDVAELFGHRSIAALLVVFALPMFLPVPAPGISIGFGIPMMFISAQLALGRQHLWLPPFLARQSMSRLWFAGLAEKVAPVLKRLESVVRPRTGLMLASWATFPVGLICLVLAIVITLPIPLGHFVPGIAVAVLALGLLERDGLAVGVGILVSVVGFAIVTAASIGVVRALASF